MNRINLICLGVDSLQASLAFYQALGFETTTTAEAPVVFFNNRGSKLELFEINQLAKDICNENPPQVDKSKFSGITLACNMKTKQEVDDLFVRVQAIGGTITKTPTTTDWGGYSGYFQDLDGYYWEIAFSEDWQFDQQDMLVIN